MKGMKNDAARPTRRALVAASLGGAAALGLTSCGDAAAPAAGPAAPALVRSKRQLKMATAWPPNFPGPGVSALRLAERVQTLTDGALEIKVFAAGELVGAFESFDATSTGATDMYHAAEYYWQGKNPAFNFFTSVPFGMTYNEFCAWLYHGGGQALWDELSAQFNVKGFQASNTGVQMGGWFAREINAPDDLTGLKMRMPGLGGEVMRRLGVNVVSLPGPEIFPALQNGTIDATEWIGPWNDMAFGFHQAAKFYYYPGWHEPGAALSCGVNLTVWNELSPQQKTAVETACAAETNISYAEFCHHSAEAMTALQDKHGVQLKRFPDAVLTELARVSGEVLAEVAARDAFTQKVHDSHMAAQKKVSRWSAIAEEAYWQARRLSQG